jgi:ribA/ribD-fused uncharacterized protein
MNRDYVVHDEHNIKGFFDEYRWLSNFHVCQILWNGMLFTSTEAAYQSAKCLYKDDAMKFTQYDPKTAKQQGRLITRTRPQWDVVRFNVMAEVTFLKYLHHKDLREKLLDTADMYIEETNGWKDQYFGVYNGIGENNLGRILMATREYFKFLETKNKLIDG